MDLISEISDVIGKIRNRVHEWIKKWNLIFCNRDLDIAFDGSREFLYGDLEFWGSCKETLERILDGDVLEELDQVV